MKLNERLGRIEAKRARLLDELSDVDPSWLGAHPRPGKWSVLEIVEHLVLSEDAVFGDPARLEVGPPLRRGPKNRVLFLVVMFVLRFDIPVKVPSRAMAPRGGGSLADLRLRWEANHHRLRGWVEASDASRLRSPLFRHPVSGPMTISNALWMLDVHLDRHTRQIRGLVRLLDGPPAGAEDASTEDASTHHRERTRPR